MSVIRPEIQAAVRAVVRKSSRLDITLPKQLTRGLLATALVLGLGAAAQAQQKPADEAPAGGGAPSLEEVTVTGSRIKRGAWASVTASRS